MKSIIINLLLIIISVSEMLLLKVVNSNYLGVPFIKPYILILTGIIAFSIFELLRDEENKTKTKGMRVATSMLILMVLPMNYYYHLPGYTYAEAVEFTQEKEKIEIIDGPRKLIYDENLQPRYYVITGEQSGQKKAYLFDPYAGSYSDLWE